MTIILEFLLLSLSLSEAHIEPTPPYVEVFKVFTKNTIDFRDCLFGQVDNNAQGPKEISQKINCILIKCIIFIKVSQNIC